MRIALLASGGLGFQSCRQVLEKYEVKFIMTDKNSTEIISLAKQQRIDLFVGNPRNVLAEEFIQNKEADVLISVNYLFLINQNLIDAAKILAFNIHGSLLPKYRGRTPHVWAIINNEKETGITAHIIDDSCDTGDIIKQIKVEIGEDDTGSSVLSKYEALYYPLIESVLSDVQSSKINTIKQDNSIATYFGKRTADDGRIDWNWQKERIRNWVRAQSSPYPGAFTFYEQNKIIIDEIKFSDRAYSYDMPNGKILSLDPLEIKTANGAVRITKLRTDEIKMELSKCFK